MAGLMDADLLSRAELLSSLAVPLVEEGVAKWSSSAGGRCNEGDAVSVAAGRAFLAVGLEAVRLSLGLGIGNPNAADSVNTIVDQWHRSLLMATDSRREVLLLFRLLLSISGEDLLHFACYLCH